MTTYTTDTGTKFEVEGEYRLTVHSGRGTIGCWSTLIPGTIAYVGAIAAGAFFVSVFLWWLLVVLPGVWIMLMLVACNDCDSPHMKFFHNDSRTVLLDSYIKADNLKHPVYKSLVGNMVDEIKSDYSNFDKRWWEQQLKATNKKMVELNNALNESKKAIRMGDYSKQIDDEINGIKIANGELP